MGTFACLVNRGSIFCDESGITGPDLLHPTQPYFSYATVGVLPEEANELVARLTKDHHIQGGELKGRRLLRFASGRRVVAEVFQALEGRYKVALFEKRFALACKFYEYIFEPSLATHSLLFYALRFHLFIANLLYLHFTQNCRHADRIFAEFQEFMWKFDESKLVYLNGKLKLPDEPPPLELVGAFTVANFGSVRDEIAALVGPTAKWTLDLSSTALHSLLGEWAETYDELDVTCDDSEPLVASKVVLDAMIGNDRKAYSTIFGENRRITYNLARPIEFGRSMDHAGIQLADVIAAATAAIFETPREAEHDRFRHAAIDGLSHNVVVLPLISDIDLKDATVRRNYMILHELVRLSINGDALLPRAAEFALRATERMRLPLPDLDRAFVTT